MEGGIIVNSYLELYTQFFGWTIYNNVWSLIKQSGFIFIPFIGIIYDGWLSSLEKSSFESVASVSFRKIVMGHVVAVFVLILAAEPVLELSPSIIQYNAPDLQVYNIKQSNSTSSVGKSNTTYDNEFSDGVKNIENTMPDLGIPILWQYALNWGNGFSYAMIAGLPQKEDLRFLQNFMQSVFIDDPMLSNEISRFATECYAPARAKFFRIKDEVPARLNANLVNDILDKYPNDLNWMGSMVLNKSQGLYAKSTNMNTVSDGYKARMPVQRFANSVDYDDARPYCDDWWQGLSGDLVELAQGDSLLGGGISNWDVMNEVVSNAYNVISSSHITQDEVIRNYVIQTFLNNTKQQMDIVSDDLAWANTSYSSNPDQISQGLAYGVKGFFAGMGSVKEGVAWSVKFYTVLLALPMIQALVLFGFIIILPFLLVFTKLGVKGAVYGFMALFSLKLLTGLWGIASWLDSTLIGAMYPDQSALGAFFSGANNEGTERILLDMMTTGMHLGIPAIFLAVMAAVGFQLGSAIGGTMGEMGQGAQKSGDNAGNEAKSQVNKAQNKVSSGIKNSGND